MKNDGGPAFASVIKVSKAVDPSSYNLGDGPEHLRYNDVIETTGNMSLRDYFAAKAMQSILYETIKVEGDATTHRVSRDAYRVADAMLAERDKC